MEKAFVWYPVYRKLPDTTRVVIIQCNLLDEPTFGYFNEATRQWYLLDEELNKEREADHIELSIKAWMELPPAYKNNEALTFLPAAETRYFMSVSASRDISVDTIDFYKIRSAIHSAAERGLSYCRVREEDITDDLIEKLRYAGYTVEEKEDRYIISWV